MVEPFASDGTQIVWILMIGADKEKKVSFMSDGTQIISIAMLNADKKQKILS